MAAGFKDHFSGVAAGYQAFRPRYPPGLFAWLAEVAPRWEVAVDLGCGSGQASVALAEHFREVIGLDPSAEQVAHAEARAGVRYLVAPAEATGLPAGCADLVVAAQALHWFDQPRFHAEVERLSRPGAACAAFTYGLCRVTPEVDEVVDRLYRPVLGPWWPPERVHVDAGYRTLPFPWPALAAPALAISETWDLPRFTGYLRTWSAVAAYQKARGEDPVALVAADLEAAWGDAALGREVTWPLTVVAARVRAPAGR